MSKKEEISYQADPEVEKKVNELAGSDRSVRGWMALLILALAIIMSVYHLYTAGFGLMPGVGTRSHMIIHLTFGLVLVYLIFPIKRGLGQTKIVWYDFIIALIALFVGYYLYANQTSNSILTGRMTDMDKFVGIALLLLVLEATRRVVGKPLVIIAGIFIAYFFLGHHLNPPFRHTRANFENFIYEMTYTTSGIFSTPLSVSAVYVFIFILFGAILEATGAGKMFIDLALRAFGKYKGGPAKAAVVSSGMLGSISGSSVANAVTTGTFTIPLMKKVGFRPQTAGGIEVAASSSGQLLPPIMGAAAFLMIEYTPYTYAEIIRSAAIPAILSYIAILFMVHIEASKHNIKGLPKEMLVSARKTMIQHGYLILPVIVLVYFLVRGNTVPNAAFFSIVILLTLAVFTHRFREKIGPGIVIAVILAGLAYAMHFVLDWNIEIAVMVTIGIFIALFVVLLQKSFKVDAAPVRFGVRELLAGFEMAARNSLTVVVACATAGILIGVINLTGLSAKLPIIIVGFAGDSLYLALAFTLVACLILGLGLPTTATYVILAAMVAPALVQMGVPIMAAHLFVLYYGILADDTPPINLPAYAVSGIANSEPIRTGVQGFKFDSGALLLPFVFATNTVILLLPENAGLYSWPVIAQNIFTALLGIIAFVVFIQNFFLVKLRFYERILALGTALVFIHGSWITDTIGIVLLALLIAIQYMRKKKADKEGQTATA
ncbi:TRAP transporter permease [Halalkalibacter alkaliphilus]|uniref:TRAP transporter permease n=1 Tax=Halalkalibacter alkaliphilus TaxID=2917993 RepID=A0A9X2CVV3_9BACI|nr:TRAP transporter permease [Halalkalibacter alkaliphilus]MCL7748967.1 TRAP transporter permease [Halalkalibacter alkaliphilus]